MTGRPPRRPQERAVPGLAWACRIAGLLAAVTGHEVRLTGTADGYRLTLAAPADPLIQGALLPVLGATARWGYASRAGLWCEVDA
ncbi:hypothetical protein [Kitasatospora sp. NPDC057015]|uniref:hypothetical protein n=1 Tax=Kitasatospora sp. NPDC057015 TaxID=3346001 RepID=UPI00362565AC